MIKNLPKPIVVIISILIIVLIGYKMYMSKYSAKKYFSDKKVVSLCNAAKKGDIKKIDELIEEGVNINAVGKTGLNPLYWLLVMNPSTDKQRIGFKYLLEKGADAMQVHEKTKWNLVHTTAQYEDPRYLEMILKYGKDLDLDMEVPDEYLSTPLLEAEKTNRSENFKLLLEYGADPNWHKQGEYFDETTINTVATEWYYVYELLRHDANWKTKREKSDKQYDTIFFIEKDKYTPSKYINGDGIDYRQKVIKFLRKKGVEVNPWMPEDEKYVTENGEDILYIKENDKWIKFTESSKYTGPTEDPTRQLTIEEWNSGKKANHGTLAERFYSLVLGMLN